MVEYMNVNEFADELRSEGMQDHMHHRMQALLNSGEYSTFDMYWDCEEFLIINSEEGIDAPISYEGDAL